MKEIFENIPWWTYYQASNLGKIKSFKRNRETIMKTFIYPDWYEWIQLFNNGKRKTIKVHRLIMLAFKWESKLDVNHINWIKNDNKLENLEYCTQRENTIHSFKMWLQIVPKWKLNKCSKKINQYDLSWKLIKAWDCMSDIKRQLWYSIGNISSCCNWKRNHVWGYMWKFN